MLPKHGHHHGALQQQADHRDVERPGGHVLHELQLDALPPQGGLLHARGLVHHGVQRARGHGLGCGAGLWPCRGAATRRRIRGRARLLVIVPRRGLDVAGIGHQRALPVAAQRVLRLQQRVRRGAVHVHDGLQHPAFIVCQLGDIGCRGHLCVHAGSPTAFLLCLGAPTAAFGLFVWGSWRLRLRLDFVGMRVDVAHQDFRQLRGGAEHRQPIHVQPVHAAQLQPHLLSVLRVRVAVRLLPARQPLHQPLQHPLRVWQQWDLKGLVQQVRSAAVPRQDALHVPEAVQDGVRRRIALQQDAEVVLAEQLPRELHPHQARQPAGHQRLRALLNKRQPARLPQQLSALLWPAGGSDVALGEVRGSRHRRAVLHHKLHAHGACGNAAQRACAHGHHIRVCDLLAVGA
mmetsp:Transcript_2869/g.7108  ORF Transcript_2869/g.7108 Transcript_2869/m.7108 type:complete len:403 (-) Transcript_2869:1242-2450(-)